MKPLPLTALITFVWPEYLDYQFASGQGLFVGRTHSLLGRGSVKWPWRVWTEAVCSLITGLVDTYSSSLYPPISSVSSGGQAEVGDMVHNTALLSSIHMNESFLLNYNQS